VTAAPTEIAVHRHPGGAPPARMGFFTDTTLCIGCKACEVACKQWNDLPADGYDARGRSFDHTGSLSAATWRHVHFVEIAPGAEPRPEVAQAPLGDAAAGGAGGHIPQIPAAGTLGAARQDLDLVALADAGALPEAEIERWLFQSDVCKHCTNAGCLDACPTGALIRTEFETVIVQPDVCNGCGYCVTACPFGVIDRDPYDGRAAKCTLCYDRLQDGLEPACAKACPTDSIQFGPYDELVERAKGRVVELHERGLETAYLYGAGDEGADQLAGGLGAFFLLTEPPERFALPAQADSPIQANVPVATAAGLAAGVAAAAGAVVSVLLAHRRARR
jgi:formate dehydrogenase iron-sulfur subunit